MTQTFQTNTLADERMTVKWCTWELHYTISIFSLFLMLIGINICAKRVCEITYIPRWRSTLIHLNQNVASIETGGKYFTNR